MLEMDMNHEKRIQQEENRVSAVEVALEMQRQAGFPKHTSYYY